MSDFTRPGVLSITNAADAVIQGSRSKINGPQCELAVRVQLRLLDAEYDTYVAPDGARLIDVSGNRQCRAQEQVEFGSPVLPAGQLWHLQLPPGMVLARQPVFTAFNRPTSAQGAYGLTNARISYYSADNQWEVQAYGENLGTKHTPPPVGSSLRQRWGDQDINPPRTVGVRLVYHWM